MMCTFVQPVYMACVPCVAHRCLAFVLHAFVHVHYVCALSVGCVLCYSTYISSVSRMWRVSVLCNLGMVCVVAVYGEYTGYVVIVVCVFVVC